MKFFTYGNFCAVKKARITSWLKGLDPAIKRMIIMRINLVAFLISISIMNVCASARAQTLNLTFKEAAITEVLAAIKKQSGYQFLYNEIEIKRAKPVSIAIKNAALKDALDQVFKDQPLNYQILDKTIVVNEKKANESKPKSAAIEITGKVTEQNNTPISGATIKVKGTDITRVTGPDGLFSVSLLRSSATLIVSFVGYETKEITIDASINNLVIVLDQETAALQEVNVVSTGYQDIPKERATGSFVKINNDLINRSVGTNIINRLDGVTSALVFNRNTVATQKGQLDINIRGRSTIFANDQPLVVVDNFPYDGDFNNINPNDIESITVLKDAAAASIWGARAGNGVIVINTKKGKNGQPLKIQLNSNVTTGNKPDAYYNPYFLKASPYIDVERDLFTRGFYNGQINNTVTRPVLSPVIEILAQNRNGNLSDAEATAKIDVLRNNDVRNDFDKYIYQKSINQQYSLSLSGGSDKSSYFLSSGFDQNRENLVRNKYDRITINSSGTYNLTRQLEVSAGLNYIQSNIALNNPGYGFTPKSSAINASSSKSLYPYAQFADANGNPLAIVKNFRNSYLSSQSALLNWQYEPITDINEADNRSKISDTRINAGIKYAFFPDLSAEIKYQFEQQMNTGRNYYSNDSFFTRNLINTYSTVSNGIVTRNIPMGAILDQSFSELHANTIRGQLNYKHNWSNKHELYALAGWEVKELIVKGSTNRLYGYDDIYGTRGLVDYVKFYPPYIGFSELQIPNVDALTETSDRYVSYFANASYTYNSRYTFTASGRKDASNLFGVNSNQRGVPLWSAGAAWAINNESFYHSQLIPYLKLRASYGFNGNVDKTSTAYVTGLYATDEYTGAQTVLFKNAANPDLRWERVKIMNAGLDFTLGKSVVSGTIEYYSKKGLDIIGNAPMAPASGVTTFRSNIANTSGNGIDVILNSNNLNGQLKWQTNFLFSYAVDKVTKYAGNPTAGFVSYSDGSSNPAGTKYPVQGRPVYSLYAYAWRGLDAATGDPQGYLNGQLSKDYAAIVTSPVLNDLVYIGSARPTKFGSFRNTFSYKGFSASANITYKLGYYFRRGSINYFELYTNWIGHKDFDQRWQKPGDEQKTNVPSMVYPASSNRDQFYNYSEVLTEKADHIRLQDITLGYEFNKVLWKQMPFSNLGIYLYAGNVGLLWKANKHGLDPDAGTYPNPRTVAFGIKAGF